MKWLLNLCYFMLFLICVKTNAVDENDCYEQFRNQTRLMTMCTYEIFLNKEAELLHELVMGLVQYSGDHQTIRTIAEKHCPLHYQSLQCSLIGVDVNDECFTPVDAAKNRIRHSLAYALLNFVCKNQGDIVVQFLVNNGFETVYENHNFYKCVHFIIDVDDIDKICDRINQAFDCYIDLVRNHQNTNLIPIANELHTAFRQALKCQVSNELSINAIIN